MSRFAVQVSWDGRVVAGLTRMSPLRTTTDVITMYDVGTGTGHSIPGRKTVATVVLERELGADLDLHRWATGPGLHKDVQVTLLGSTDGPTVELRLRDCWISEYAVAPDLATGTVLESVTLAMDHWQRVSPPSAVVAADLARAAGVAVQTVSLGRIMSRDLAVTERNLEAVFATAEESGAVLLIDEADALFEHRSSVGDSHGRYANAETNYLLQRLASHHGPVVVTPPDEG